MNASNTLKKLGIEQTFNYIYKDPDKHMPKMMDWADKFADGEFISQRKIIREAITDPEHPYYSYIRRLFEEVDPNVTIGLFTYSCKNAYLKYCLRADSLSAIVTGASPTIVSVKRDIKVGVMPLRSWISAESKNSIKSLIISRQRLY